MDKLRHPDFPVRWVLAAIGSTFALLAVAVAVITVTYSGARPGSYPRPDDFGPPRLETSPVDEQAAYLTRQESLLAGAGGRAPIEEGMRRIAERGPDAYAPLPLPEAGGGRE
jgi:hypothetical protein